MRTQVLWLALIAALPAAADERRAESRAPLRPVSECLDPARARSWHRIDSDELLVDAGRRRFHLQLSHACPEIGEEHAIVFRSAAAIGRICGNLGDMIVSAPAQRRRVACPIAIVTPLRREEYDALLAPGAPRVAPHDEAAGGQPEPRR